MSSFSTSSGQSSNPDSQSISQEPNRPEEKQGGDSDTKTQNVRNRTGCLTCKRRKKKCDETKPICKNCQRTSYVCEGYPPIRHFRGDDSSELVQDEADRSRGSNSVFPSEEERLVALVTAAQKEADVLRNRVKLLEQELHVMRTSGMRGATRLPSLKSLVQEEVHNPDHVCPTCGQPRGISNRHEAVIPDSSRILNPDEPSSIFQGPSESWQRGISPLSPFATQGLENSPRHNISRSARPSDNRPSSVQGSLTFPQSQD